MEKLIINKQDTYSIEEWKYYWKFIQGVINNQYCEVGIICDGAEVTAKEYTRQLCLFDINNRKKKYFLTNHSIVTFPESVDNWGFCKYVLGSCNGSTLWVPIDYERFIWSRTTVQFKVGNIACDFQENSLDKIKEFISDRKLSFWDRLFN
jgi:hypothetical protein